LPAPDAGQLRTSLEMKNGHRSTNQVYVIGGDSDGLGDTAA